MLVKQIIYKEELGNTLRVQKISHQHLIMHCYIKKMRQYGEENFDIEVLETIYSKDIDEVNQRKQYWIQKLQTFRGTGLGYNSDLGVVENIVHCFLLKKFKK